VTVLRRFVVPPEAVAGERVALRGREARHAAAVLRMRQGDRIIVLDGSGMERIVELVSVSPQEITGRVVENRRGAPPRTRLILIQGVPKGSKMDGIIRMGTELGVAEFVPVLTVRTVAQSSGRAARWRRIAAAAAKQSGRPDVPAVRDPMPLADALSLLPAGTMLLVLWEEERARTIASALRRQPRPRHIALLVGPEGGLDEKEVRAAAERGGVRVTLGPLVLRTETAGAAALAMTLYELELRG
jgi:16S rRNA (uracil1498-N3)-methyltransferase